MGLTATDLGTNPMAAYRAWLDHARAADLVDPDAIVVSTATRDGAPSARPVLARVVDDDGIVFFTNRDSRKGRELAANPQVAATALWTPLHRCVRFEGTAEAAGDDESDAYWTTRPHGSRLAALASPQSQPIQRDQLEARLATVHEQYPEGSDVPRPAHWGGVRIRPDRVEFWQARDFRMHDRIEFRRGADGWVTRRLAP